MYNPYVTPPWLVYKQLSSGLNPPISNISSIGILCMICIACLISLQFIHAAALMIDMFIHG